jgi:hypothetical protein
VEGVNDTDKDKQSECQTTVGRLHKREPRRNVIRQWLAHTNGTVAMEANPSSMMVVVVAAQETHPNKTVAYKDTNNELIE